MTIEKWRLSTMLVAIVAIAAWFTLWWLFQWWSLVLAVAFVGVLVMLVDHAPVIPDDDEE